MTYKFIDLFAGIGGFHVALKMNGMDCVFASEIDKAARQTYIENHRIDLKCFNEDINDIDARDVPDHDVLCAGFPCQPFSQAGFKKGLEDNRGNLFFNILEILKAKRPKAFILENVKHLLKHDNSRTFNIIFSSLIENDFYTEYKIIKASDFGLPQLRPRIFFVGFDNRQVDTSNPFLFPKEIPLEMNMSDVWGAECSREIGFTLRVGGKGSGIHDRRNWDGYVVNGKEVRLTPQQGKMMMGLPQDFKFPVSNSQAMKQLGNSVCVNVVDHIAKEIIDYLEK